MNAERDSTGRMKLLLEAWHGDYDRMRRGKKKRKRETEKTEGNKIKKEKHTHDSKVVNERQCVYFPLRPGVRQP